MKGKNERREKRKGKGRGEGKERRDMGKKEKEKKIEREGRKGKGRKGMGKEKKKRERKGNEGKVRKERGRVGTEREENAGERKETKSKRKEKGIKKRGLGSGGGLWRRKNNQGAFGRTRKTRESLPHELRGRMFAEEDLSLGAHDGGLDFLALLRRLYFRAAHVLRLYNESQRRATLPSSRLAAAVPRAAIG